MRIHIQNMPWMNYARTQIPSMHLLSGSLRTADAQRIQKQKEVNEKIEVLSRGSEARSVEPKTQNKTLGGFSDLLVSGKDVQGKTAGKINEYYQAVGAVTDGITYMETRLKYLQSEYEKMDGYSFEKKMEKMRELMESEYKDMTGLLNVEAGMMAGELYLSSKVYGKAFGEEYQSVLGDIPDRIRDIAAGLKGSGSVKEALGQLADAKKKLGGLGEELKGRYREYTGKELVEYNYRTESDFKDSVKSYGLLWSWDEITIDTSEVRNLSDYGVDIKKLSEIPEAVNIIDIRA